MMDTHGNGLDVITPLAAIIRDLARQTDHAQLCTDKGSERAATLLNVRLAAQGLAVESFIRRHT